MYLDNPSKPKVSIALTTYNGEKYLKEQLNSFTSQTIPPDELVICDDCSTDGTCSIIKEYMEVAPFKVVFVQNEKNLGYAQNFSKALSLCTGEIVFLSDQDDVWNENKIARILDAFDNNPIAQLIIHDLEFCNSDLELIGQRKLDRVRAYSDPMRNYMTGMATSIRSQFLKLCLPVPVGVTHDAWLHKCAEMLGLKCIVSESLAYYRRHESNVTMGMPLNALQQSCKLDSIKDFLKNGHYQSLQYMFTRMQNQKSWLSNNCTFLVNLGYIPNSDLDKLLLRLEKTLMAIQTRVRYLELHRTHRIGKIFKYYIQGGYQDFSGIKSAIKDMLSKHHRI